MGSNKMNDYVFEGLCEDLVRESLSVITNVTEEEFNEVMDNFKELVYNSIEVFGNDIDHTPYSTFLLEHIIGLYLILIRQQQRN